MKHCGARSGRKMWKNKTCYSRGGEKKIILALSDMSAVFRQVLFFTEQKRRSGQSDTKHPLFIQL